MRKVKRVPSCQFDEGHSGHFVARHCGKARRSVAQTLERFAASGLIWASARELENEARIKRPPQPRNGDLAQDRHHKRRRAFRHSPREGDPHSGTRHRRDGHQLKQD